MPNLIIAIAFAVLTLNFFTVSHRITGINRTIYNVPISLFEVNVPLAQESDDFVAYFDKEKLEDNLTSFFYKSISKYTDSFTLSYYYYNQNDFSFCSSSFCNAIEITISARVVHNFTYQKTARFYIRNNH